MAKFTSPIKLFFITCSLLIVAGCVTLQGHKAPIKQVWTQPLRTSITYVVQTGDSLYSIAWLYGLDYHQVARDNNIKKPYTIYVGQHLQLNPPLTGFLKGFSSKQESEYNPLAADQTRVASESANIRWDWPVQGRIIEKFGEKNKGINIASELGAPIRAAATGTVVYVGNSLRDYGQLIIIKHNKNYLSVYAHNQKLLVNEGDQVALGQQIATVGTDFQRRSLLHFEIRQNGNPVDPCNYLPGTKTF